MEEVEKYDFSYTGLSLAVNDMHKVALMYKERETIDIEVFGKGKTSTGKRKLSVVNKRLSTLSLQETELLISQDLTIQKQIALLAVCKTHLFIRDFIVEVISEKLLLFDHQLSEGDFMVFLRRKEELHPELEKLTDNTKAKIRQVTFKILEQSGIIDGVKTKVIVPQWLDNKVINTITNDDKHWLKVFLMSDTDIENIN